MEGNGVLWEFRGKVDRLGLIQETETRGSKSLPKVCLLPLSECWCPSDEGTEGKYQWVGRMESCLPLVVGGGCCSVQQLSSLETVPLSQYEEANVYVLVWEEGG